MTGVGTQADPYVVFTWDELLSTVVQEDVFVELGADIDCKELGAVTIENSYEFRCYLEGNGHCIKNLYLYQGSSLFFFSKNHPISNLTFKNIYIDYTNALFQFKSDHPMYYYLPTFINCHFSAELVNGGSFIDNINTHLYCAVFRKCTFHILCKDSTFTRGRSYSDDRRPILLDDCVLELYGTFRYSIFSVQLVNSYVTGEVTLTEIGDYDPDPAIKIISVGCYKYYSGEFMKSNSVVDLIVHNETGKESIPYMVYNNINYIDDTTGDYMETTPTLFVNTEVLEDFERDTRYSGTFHACTLAQIHDETYLRSEGFVAEEIWENRYMRKLSLNCNRYNHQGASTLKEGAYINTGIINTSGRRIISEFEFTTANVGFAVGGYDTNGDGTAHGTSTGSSIDSNDAISTNISDTYYGFVGTKFYCEGKGTPWWAYQNECPMIINGRNVGGDMQYGMNGKIYHIKLRESDLSLLRDFIPAYDTQNNEYGMYDTANNVFYGSSNPNFKFDSGDEMPFKFVDGKLIHHRETEVIKLGAFCNDTLLARIALPEATKELGLYSFHNSGLKEVALSEDCIFYPTTFPEGCVIKYYEEV